MRILLIAPTNTPHACRPVRSLLREGHEVCFIGRSPASDPFARESPAKYTFIPEPAVAADYTPLVLTLETAKKVFRPDVVHIHWADIRVKICDRLGLHPLVVSVWGSDVNMHVRELDNGGFAWSDPPSGGAAHVLQALAAADCLIVDAPSMADKCAFITGGSVPVRVLSPGVDDFFFEATDKDRQAIRDKLRLPREKILTAARLLRPVYRNELVLEAFARVAGRHDAALVLKTFLSDGEDTSDYLRSLQKKATQLGLWKKARFCAPLSPADLRNLYAASTAVINMPARDAFPVSFLEAAACQTRVITCPHPAYAVPLVRDCFDVLPDDTVESLAAAMQRSLETPPAADADRRRAARDLAWREYRHARYVRECITMYETLTA